MDEYIDSKEVFYSILDALECYSRIGKGWKMWNDKPVDCQFRTKIKPDRAHPAFNAYTCRVLGSMLKQALDLEFGENFFPSTQKEEKDYYRKSKKPPKENNYVEAKYDYIINLIETMGKLCNCNNDKYSESSIVLKTLMTHIRSVYDDYKEEDFILDSFKVVKYKEEIKVFIYTFFMYYMRDVAYNKKQIPFKETNELLLKILLSDPFYETIYTNLSNMGLPEYIHDLEDLEKNGKKYLSRLKKKSEEEAEKRKREVQYNFQLLNDLMEKINEFITGKDQIV